MRKTAQSDPIKGREWAIIASASGWDPASRGGRTSPKHKQLVHRTWWAKLRGLHQASVTSHCVGLHQASVTSPALYLSVCSPMFCSLYNSTDKTWKTFLTVVRIIEQNKKYVLIKYMVFKIEILKELVGCMK